MACIHPRLKVKEFTEAVNIHYLIHKAHLHSQTVFKPSFEKKNYSQ